LNIRWRPGPRADERGAARAIERLQQTLLGEAKALDRDDRRSPHG